VKRRPRVVVAGLGLVGGSLARALRRARYEVVGVDRPAVLRAARAAGALSAGFEALGPALAGADVLVLAVPPRASLRLLRSAARLASPALVITDVTSVKRPVMAEARRLGLRQFVGGHPIAGTEGRGFAASSPDLFRGRTWVLTPAGARASAVRTVRGLVRATGGRPVSLTAAEHDRALAFLSHLPQVVAWSLRAAAAGDPTTRRRLGLAGPGFRDMTRLARSPRRLWSEILAANRGEVRRALAAFVRALPRDSRR
jgi:prephenate dehydrogenase